MFSTSSFKLAHKRLGSDCQIRTPNCSPSRRISSPQTAWFGLTNPNPKLLSLKTDLFPTNRSVRIAKSEPHWAGICQSPASVDGSWSGNSSQTARFGLTNPNPTGRGFANPLQALMGAGQGISKLLTSVVCPFSNFLFQCPARISDPVYLL